MVDFGLPPPYRSPAGRTTTAFALAMAMLLLRVGAELTLHLGGNAAWPDARRVDEALLMALH